MSLIDNFTTGLQHIGIPTKDMAATTAFWTSLGFTVKGTFDNDGVTVKFFEYKNVVIESWEGAEATGIAGAINHISLDTTDIQKAFNDVKAHGFKMVENEIQHLPFWEHGIQYFNITGPNGEVVEFCHINE